MIEQLEIVSRLRTAFMWIDRLASEATSARKLIDHLDQAVLAKRFGASLCRKTQMTSPPARCLSASARSGRRRARRAVEGKDRRRRGRILAKR
jgi:type I restriction enzyme S subunit